MKRGDSLEKIAAKFQIDTNRLRQINGITRRHKVGAGFNLLVPRPGSQANPDLIARALPQLPPEKAPVVSRSKGGKGSRAATARAPAKSVVKSTGKSVPKPVAKSSAKPVQKKVPAKAPPKKKH
jgi:hypothetical protein